MLILTLRTDKPESEVGLYDSGEELSYTSWLAHRQLAETLHSTIKEALSQQQKEWSDIEGIVVYKGPGSFTGLRIGLSLANSLADSLQIPIVGVMGEDWAKTGLAALQKGSDDKLVLPEYGADVHITVPKK